MGIKRFIKHLVVRNLKWQREIVIFFCVYDFTDIDECKGNHSCHVNAMQFYNPPEKNLPRKATKADL